MMPSTVCNLVSGTKLSTMNLAQLGTGLDLMQNFRWPQVGKSYATPREALLLNAKFVTAQLSGLDGTAAAGSTKFSELPFLASLIQEVRSSPACMMFYAECSVRATGILLHLPLIGRSDTPPLTLMQSAPSAGARAGAAGARRPRGRAHDDP